MSAYERFGEHPPSADAFDLASRLAAQSGQSLAAFIAGGDALSALGDALRKANSPLRMHGRRVEEMFGYVAAVLGASVALKREDAGPLIAPEGTSITIPDWRVVLPKGREILVEVKNCHHRDPARKIRLEIDYLRRLNTYGEVFQRPVFVAVYWSRWHLWTLHPVSELIDANTQSIPFCMLNAVPASHMRLLGDVSLATVHPLVLRFVVDAERVADDDAKSLYQMMIRNVEMFARSKKIQTKGEKDIAWYFMLNGRWSEEGPTPIMSGGEVKAIEFVFRPDEPDQAHDVAIVAAASTMASIHFNSLTTQNGEITSFRPRRIRDHPYPKPKSQYSGTVLPIWRFIMQPSPLKDWGLHASSLKDC